MIREIAAGLLIALLITASLLNARHIDRLTDTMISELEQAESAVREGDFEAARKMIEHSRDAWTKHRDYTYAAMRHEETDAVFDGFYDLLESLPKEDADALCAGFDRLIYRIRVIGVREHISIASIF